MDNPCRYCFAPKRHPGCQTECEEGIAFKEYKQTENEYNKSLTISFVSDHEHAKRVKAIQDNKDDKKRRKKCTP